MTIFCIIILKLKTFVLFMAIILYIYQKRPLALIIKLGIFKRPLILGISFIWQVFLDITFKKIMGRWSFANFIMPLILFSSIKIGFIHDWKLLLSNFNWLLMLKILYKLITFVRFNFFQGLIFSKKTLGYVIFSLERNWCFY